MDHPLVQALLILLGAFFGLSFLAQLSALLPAVAMLIASTIIGVAWTLNYERARLHDFYTRNAWARPVIGGVCKLLNEQPPIASGALPNTAPATVAVGTDSACGFLTSSSPPQPGANKRRADTTTASPRGVRKTGISTPVGISPRAGIIPSPRAAQ